MWTPGGWRATAPCCWCGATPGDGGRVRRLLCRCGVPDHLLRLLGGDPVVAQVLAAVRASACWPWWPAKPWRSGTAGSAPARAGQLAGYPDAEVLAPFLLVAPLLVLAGVAAAFLPMFDPAFRLAVAAPFSGFTLLLVRSVSALAAALVPVVAAAFLLPGPGWLPAALLLPSLALCAFALAAATVLEPRAAAVTAGALWAVPVLCCWRRRTFRCRSCRRTPSSRAPPCCAPAAAVLLARRDRFEWGWTR